ncbi:MAG: ABC transporter ATP-binding protein [Dehalococcoidia bacterium]
MIRISGLKKIYGHGTSATHALKGVSLEVEEGAFVAIMGRSGSGKSTLLHILGLLDMPTSGEVWIDGSDVLRLRERDRAGFRLAKLGYVFQESSLIPELTILENVYAPAMCLDRENNYKKRALELLDTVGLGDRVKHHPSEVSGGEQQRAAIARALINRPQILLADEPTANLDLASAKMVLDLFSKFNKEYNQTIVMVTHEPEDEKYVDRAIWLGDGLVIESGKPSAA